ncbi:MAG: zinc-ribbon domain-containing protein, partial [Lachnospiraceae bacterium]|nr:zinc-ribbon domain-containing protein [Lachnospiraceae bacterium]
MKKRECLADNQLFLSEFDYSKNIDVDPNSITVGSPRKLWWKCHKCGYEWSASL